ncbi:MAG: L,D-transpeptidase family protein [Daejeonella sp.]
MNNFCNKYIPVALLMCISLNSCGQPGSKQKSPDIPEKNWNASIPGSFTDQDELSFDSVEINNFFKNHPQVKGVQNDVVEFYSSRNYAYAWFDNGKLIEQAGNLFNRIINLENEGLSAKIPYQKTLDSLFNLPETAHQKKPDILLELLLTSDYFVFSKLSWEGMDESVSESLKWHLPRKKVNYEHYLDSLLKNPDRNALPKEPVYRQYDLLKTYLKKYKDLERREAWTTLSPEQKQIRPGDSSVFIAQLKKRLYLLEDYQGDTSSRFYDKGLSDALKIYQQRNGLTVDGQIGAETLSSINVPLKTRIRQIIANMERNRWLPISSHKDVLAVNIPDFKLHVFHADSLLWSCKVVVGQSTHPTTVFYGDLEYVVFRPYWNVPESIVKNELLPEMRKSANYLAAHDMEITGYRNSLPVIRQQPGPNNSLGLVKFLFPNSYNTYLHDTPAKSLFGETSRAFSHGCIRVEEPVKLANFLLKYQPEWSPEKINSAMQNGNERFVKLKNTVPVYIAYFTAFVSQDQKLNFRKDIYNLDEHLANMILEDR